MAFSDFFIHVVVPRNLADKSDKRSALEASHITNKYDELMASLHEIGLK